MSAVGYPSDSQMLVEACVARLRAEARLDDEPVLPTIDVLPDDDETFDVLTGEIVVCADVAEIPSAASIVRQVARANREAEARPDPTPRAAARRPVRWPLVLCALVAIASGVTAFLRSPVGDSPSVQRVLDAARSGLE